MSSSLDLSRQYTSFSGCDIRVVIDGESVAQVQAVSYAIQREKAPIHTLGHKDPVSFARGKRAIAGTMVWVMFDTHLMSAKPFFDNKFIAAKDEIMPDIDDLNNAAAPLDDLRALDDSFVFDSSDLAASYQLQSAWYVDQLPPFDIVVVAANEYGKAASMRIYGAEILNEGTGFSIDNMVIEDQMTYIARSIAPWRALGSWDMSTGAWTGSVGAGGGAGI